MPDAALVHVAPALAIPLAELRFQATRSGGPGGQHVNTSSTRVELWWDVERSPSLTGAQRQLIRLRLRNRLTGDGMLRIVSAATRSQAQNKAAAVTRFREVVARALVVPKRRRPTRPTRSSVERRLSEKRKRGEQKRERRRPRGEE
jgi:ribosome-associated protein